VLKRLGDTEEAHRLFRKKAEACVPPLDERVLSTIWHSAVGFYRKISAGRDYVPPDEYAALHGDFLYKPSDQSDVAEARVLAEVFSGQLRFSPATDFIVYNGDIWEESKPRAHAVMHDLSDMQLEEATVAATAAYKALEQNGAAELLNRASKKKAQSSMDKAQWEAYTAYLTATAYQATAMNYRQSKNIKAVLAEVQPMVLIRPQDLDADPFLLNAPGCAYDLRRGLKGVMPHSADHFVTKMTAVQPGDQGKDIWEAALNTFLPRGPGIDWLCSAGCRDDRRGQGFRGSPHHRLRRRAQRQVHVLERRWRMCWAATAGHLRGCPDGGLQAQREARVGRGQGQAHADRIRIGGRPAAQHLHRQAAVFHRRHYRREKVQGPVCL
jgi:hypothetical protein